MKSALRISTLVIGMSAIGFIAGRWQGVASRGYFYTIHDRQTFDSPNGTVEWRNVTKSTGLPLMNPGRTELEYQGRLLFSADRAFQENHPYARDVAFDGRNLTWDDGDYAYSLIIEESKHRK